MGVGELLVLVLVLMMMCRNNTVTGHLRFDDPGTQQLQPASGVVELVPCHIACGVVKDSKDWFCLDSGLVRE